MPERDPDPDTDTALLAAASAAARAFAGQEPETAPAVPGYRLRTVLGRGAQGSVWLAEHLATGREVAVKVSARRQAFAAPAERERFQREVRILARLQHPNLVAVFDSGTTACGRAFFAMDRVRGQRFDAFALECGRASRPLAAAMARIAAAVHRAHQAGVVHRDLKPGNLMVDQDGEPRVLDFGLAAMPPAAPAGSDADCDGERAAEGFVGSPLWTSPEQATPGAEAETRSDVHALGAVLYDALCGAPPFAAHAGADLGGLLAAVRTQPAPSLRQLRPDLDPELVAIAMHCLHKRPEDRYQSAGDLQRDLERWLGGLPLAILRHRRGYRLRKFVVRHQLGVAAGSGAVLAVTAGLLLALWSWRETLREREHLRCRNAANQVLLAAHAIDDDLVGRARELLAAVPLDLRDWEWRRLCWQTDRSARQVDCGVSMAAVAAAPDGSWIAAGGRGGALRSIDAATGASRPLASPFAADVTQLVASVDGRWLCGVAEDGRGARWSLEHPAAAPALHEFGAEVNGLALHPDGDRCAVAFADGRVQLWSWQRAEVLAELRCADVDGVWRRALAFAPAGDQVGVVDGSTLRFVGAADLAAARELRLPAPTAVFAFVAGGDRLLVGTRGGHLLLLRAADGRVLQRRQPHGNWIYRVAEGPGEHTLLSAGSDHTVKLWDADSLRLRTTLRGHGGRVFDAAFVGALGQVASVGEDCTLRTWARDTVDNARRFDRHRDQVWALAWSADGRRIATASSDGTLLVHDAGDERVEPVIVRAGARLQAVATAPAGDRVAFGSAAGEVGVIAGADGGVVWRRIALQSRVVGLGWSADGAVLVAGTGSGGVAVFDPATGRQLRRWRAAAEPCSFAVSPTADRVLLGGFDGRVLVLDAADGRELAALPAHPRTVFGVAFDRDGRRFASAGLDGTARVWDAATFAPICELRGHRNGVRAVAFHPGGTRVVTGGWDGTARLWDASTGELVLTLRGHDGRVEAAAFDAEGLRLATADVYGGLCVWDAAARPQ